MTGRLPVNELFETIQGEAHFTGTPATFVRLQFCDVGCPWCDTKHTWGRDPADEVSAEIMLKKTGDLKTYCWMEPRHLLATIIARLPRHVVITGGEPAAYDLISFTGMLHSSGYSVQLETSGTYLIQANMATWITLSPKIDMPGGRELVHRSVGMANEIKMPIGKMRDIYRLKEVLQLAKPGIEVWLQPLSQSPKATELCIEQATINNWKVSIQTHKYIGAR